MSCEQTPFTKYTPKKSNRVPVLRLGTGLTLKSVGENISCREIHSKEALLPFDTDAHGKILYVGEFAHNFVGAQNLW
jgi:hypothetical protein